jgi:cellulose synthase/poly-beta-1,6-N-acetylglucosamine synthase-like glycosyltransferase
MSEQSIDSMLAERRQTISPRFSPPPTPPASLLIHAAVLVLWIALILRAFGGGGLFAWSAGLIYIAYDTLLLCFVFRQTLRLIRPRPPAAVSGLRLPTTTIIVAAHDEEAALPATLAALAAQTHPPDRILIADDGSTDGTGALLTDRYGLTPLGDTPDGHLGQLRWLRLPQGGKARALNQAIALADTELVLTIDADTLIEPDALEAMVRAFAADPSLVAATGVLNPFCAPGLYGRAMQWFQTYEYIRNFLSRSAWQQVGGLLLLSGAFACYRRQELLAVGGFDPDCLVEDYELTHRLRDHAGRLGIPCHTAVIGAAQGRTEVPGTIPAFLRQRRRWFGGFLQTQYWYRHMVGARRYGMLGTVMLPVKAIDTMQPFYGLVGAVLLAIWLVSGRLSIVGPIAAVIGAKIVLDIGFHLWTLVVYRRWLGRSHPLGAIPAVIASLIEPFSFQLLRHTGAALGWVSFVSRSRRW